jgi:hypothetical protein
LLLRRQLLGWTEVFLQSRSRVGGNVLQVLGFEVEITNKRIKRGQALPKLPTLCAGKFLK